MQNSNIFTTLFTYSGVTVTLFFFTLILHIFQRNLKKKKHFLTTVTSISIIDFEKGL